MTSKERKALKAKLDEIASIIPLTAYPDVAVLVTSHYDDKFYHAIGWATCGPKDKWDEGIGYEIAIGRALGKIVDRIARRQKSEKVESSDAGCYSVSLQSLKSELGLE